MKLLAIDTSTDLASVALASGKALLSKEQPSPKTHAQLLLPMIDALLAESQLALNQLDGIVFGCGPGSFTGLRIACSIAKGLAYAGDLAMFPVGSLDAIAYEVRWGSKAVKPDKAVLAVLDARMQELYWGYYSAESLLASAQVNSLKNIILPSTEPIIMAGLGIETYWPEASSRLQAQVSHKISCYPTAAAMIQLVQQAAIAPVTAAAAQPVYVRNQVTQGEARG